MIIRNRKTLRSLSVFLSINFLLGTIVPTYVQASNNGPNAPEAGSFEPVDATDMVQLNSGDMSYVLPLLNVPSPGEGGFPVSLNYHAGIAAEQESTWLGLGWNINPGTINRNLNAIPDDWNGGKTLDFIYYKNLQKYYSISVGIGVSKMVDVGVGLSWGSNKSVSGSVSASVGDPKSGFGAGASLSTDGSYSVGISFEKGAGDVGMGLSGKIGEGNLKMGGGLGISGETKNGKISGSLGISFSNDGIAMSISASGGKRRKNGRRSLSGSQRITLASFNNSDYDVKQTGITIPLIFIPVSLGYQEVLYSLQKSYAKTGYGLLYANNTNLKKDDPFNTIDNNTVNQFNDYQHRYVYGDVYDQEVPLDEEDFVSHYDAKVELNNFTSAGYDDFNVNSNGLTGSMNAYLFDNINLYGLGYQGTDKDDSNRDLKVYNHHGSYQTSRGITSTTRPQEFYFYGSFINDEVTNSLGINTAGTGNNLNSYLSGTINTSANNTRKRQGTYVQTFTNNEIGDNQSANLLLPVKETKVDGMVQFSAENRNDRKQYDKGYDPDGVGGFMITSADGKTYHYSQPVYQYELVELNTIKNEGEGEGLFYDINANDFRSEKRQYSRYATHWLLTAVTGPDFVDNGNGIADEEDLGYWVRMDYGQWSDGFAWRAPFEGVTYRTRVKGEIGKDDTGYFTFGRKQLYYLDRIQTRTHTALFVKDLRYDGKGTSMSYAMTENSDIQSEKEYESNNVQDKFAYQEEYQLKLNKILLLRNEHAHVIGRKGNSQTNLNNYTGNLISGYGNGKSSGYTLFKVNEANNFRTGGNYTAETKLRQEDKVIDVTDIEEIHYQNVLKEINFEHSYKLATESLSSIKNSKNPNQGRLTLDKVEFKGRDHYQYIPPYEFSYIGENQPFISISKMIEGIVGTPEFSKNYYEELLKNRDPWGYVKNNPMIWSLNKIKTPQGAEIEIAYEKDEYLKEAFSRAYWTNNSGVQFSFKESSGDKYVEFRSDPNDIAMNDFDFTKYFKVGDDAFADVVFDREPESGDRYYAFYTGEFPITYVSKNTLKLDLPDIAVQGDRKEGDTCDDYPWSSFFNYGDVVGRGWHSGTGNGCNAGDNDGDNTLARYKLIATRVPENLQGGGIRVARITTKDTKGKRLTSTYTYTNPLTKESSGVTSYAPSIGPKFVPYQTEVPQPSVMYEWVRMTTFGDNGNKLGSMRYRYHTLKPILNVFDPNVKLEYGDDEPMFEATVVDYSGMQNNIEAKKISLKKNLGLIGSLRSTETFNKEDQLLSKTENDYESGEAILGRTHGAGKTVESFQNMKSIFSTNDDAFIFVDGKFVRGDTRLKKRLLNISEKIEYNSVLNSSRTITTGGVTSINYSNPDPNTGSFRTSQTFMPDGTVYTVVNEPAYAKYGQMGSKVDNVNNKHMLTQQAVETKYLGSIGSNNILSQHISTWKDWNTSSNGIGLWRKHKNYVWKGEVNENGTYKNFQPFTAWTTENAVSGWQKVSEITKYNNYSVPLETVDINGHYAASRYDKNDEFVIASGNAEYSDFYATGFEYNEDLTSLTRRPVLAHTGKGGYLLSSNGLSITMKNKAGNYKIALWSTNQETTVNGKEADEVVKAGPWYLLNYYQSFSANKVVQIVGSSEIDDVRIHPVTSTINSYVYDQYGQLSAILNGNNMGTQFEYDAAGRLKTTFMEYSDKSDLEGGFKRSSAHRYHYKNLQN